MCRCSGMRVSHEVMGELVKDDGLACGPALSDKSLERQRDDPIGVVRPAGARALTDPDGRHARPSRDDTDEGKHGIDVALHGGDIREAPLRGYLKGRAEEVHRAAACELARPLLLRGVHGGAMLVT